MNKLNLSIDFTITEIEATLRLVRAADIGLSIWNMKKLTEEDKEDMNTYKQVRSKLEDIIQEYKDAINRANVDFVNDVLL